MMDKGQSRSKYFDLTEYIDLGYDLSTTNLNGKRHYNIPSGEVYPSVTTVLSTMNSDVLTKWKQRVGEEEAKRISQQAATRGTAVHLLAEKYLQNDDKFAEGAMPSNFSTFKQIQSYLDKHCDIVYGNETPLYSHKLKTAGRCDLVARIHGIRTIGDFKTAKKWKKEEWITNYFYQCTAYAIMLHERTGAWCPQICLMIATDEDGLQPIIKRTIDYAEEVFEFFKNYHEKAMLTEVKN